MVDYENRHSAGLKGLERLSKQDNLFVFYGISDKVDFDVLQQLSNCNASVSYFMNSFQSPNALDFQLVFYMGRLVGKFKGKELQFIIISDDKGYDAVTNCKEYVPMDFVKIQRFHDIASYFNKSENREEPKTLESIYEDIKGRLKELSCSKEEISTVLKEIRVCYWDSQNVHNHLQKVYGRRGSKLYGYVKNEIRAYIKLKTMGGACK